MCFIFCNLLPWMFKSSTSSLTRKYLTQGYTPQWRGHMDPFPDLNDFSALWFVFPLSQKQMFCNKSACLSPERARCFSSISSFLHFTGFCFSWNFSRNSLWSHCRVLETWSKHLLLLKVLTKGTSKQHNKAQEICSVLWASKIRNATRQNQTEPAKQTACSQKNDHSGLYYQLLSKTWFI